MVKTAQNTLLTTFDDYEGLDEFMKLPDSEKRASLRNEGFSNNADRDYEVAFASSNIHQALMYLIQYQYPIDIDAGVKIDNPVDFYMNHLRTTGGGILKPATAPNPPPLFTDFKEELRLFEEYQSGNEHMGQSSWTNGWTGDKEVMFEKEGGLLAGSASVFASKDLMNDGAGGRAELGAAEKLLLSKIENAEKNGHFQEARALCIEILKKQLDKRTTPAALMTEIAKLEYDIDKKEGSKIRAQARLGVEAERDKLIKSGQPIPPSIATPGAMMATIDTIAKTQIKESAIIEAYGTITDGMDPNDPGLSTLEKSAVQTMHSLNGKGWKLSAENADFAGSLAKTITEIIMIEVVTAGFASFAGGALGVNAGRATAAAEGAAHGSRALGLQRYGFAAGSRLRTALFGAGAAPGRIGRAAEYMAGSTRGATALRTTLHATTFVEMQGALNGEFVEPWSAEGATQIAMMASTFYGLGKMQQFMRGTTRAAGNIGRLPAGAAPARIDRLMLGGVSRRIGRSLADLEARGTAGKIAVSGIEIGSEIGGFYALGAIQEEAAVLAHELTGGAIGFSQTQKEAMQETDGWRKFAAIAAPVLGLRTWRAVKERPVQRESHNANIIAKSAAEGRYKNGVEKVNDGVPTEVLIGTERVALIKDGVDIRIGEKNATDLYKEALKIEPEPARAERLAELDRLIASRLILREGKVVEYETEAEAKAAKEGIVKDYPEWKDRLIVEPGGTKFYLRREGTATPATPERTVTTGPKKSLLQRLKDWNAARKAKKAAKKAARETPPAPATQESTPAPATPEGTPRTAPAEGTPAPATPEGTPRTAPAEGTPAPATPEGTARPETARTPEGRESAPAESREPTHTIPGREIKAHDADIVASSLSGNRFSNGEKGVNQGTPTEAKIGEKTVNIEDIRLPDGTVKEAYERAMKDPATKETELPKLDRVVASRAILRENGAVEYKTAKEATEAKEAIQNNYPEWGELVVETVGERTYLRRGTTYDADTQAYFASESRARNIGKGWADTITIDGKEVNVENTLINGEKYVDAAQRIMRENPPEKHAELLAQLDRLLVSRVILENSGTLSYKKTDAGVEAAKEAIKIENPTWELVLEETPDSFLLRRSAKPKTVATPDGSTPA